MKGITNNSESSWPVLYKSTCHINGRRHSLLVTSLPKIKRYDHAESTWRITYASHKITLAILQKKSEITGITGKKGIEWGKKELEKTRRKETRRVNEKRVPSWWISKWNASVRSTKGKAVLYIYMYIYKVKVSTKIVVFRQLLAVWRRSFNPSLNYSSPELNKKAEKRKWQGEWMSR